MPCIPHRWEMLLFLHMVTWRAGKSNYILKSVCLDSCPSVPPPSPGNWWALIGGQLGSRDPWSPSPPGPVTLACHAWFFCILRYLVACSEILSGLNNIPGLENSICHKLSRTYMGSSKVRWLIWYEFASTNLVKFNRTRLLSNKTIVWHLFYL